MKKFTTLAALIAMTIGSATAETLIPGTSSLTPGSPTTSSSASLPIYFDGNDADGSTWYSGSQSIIPASLLSKIAPATAADGSTTTAKISALTFTLAEGSAYIDSGTLEIDCWIQNVDSDEFAKVNNKYQWGSYTDGVKGHASFDGESFNYGGDLDVTITFDTPLAYEGKALQLTFSASCDFTDWYSSWFGGVYTFNPGVGHVCSGLVNGDSEPNMTGNISQTTSVLPAVQLTYETETTEPVASEPVRGEATTALVGPYNNASVGSESSGAVLPFDMRYDNSYCQVLYTPDVLTGLNRIIDGNPSKAEISSLTFKMMIDYAMLEGQKNFTVYVQNVDENSFPVVNSKLQWFTVDTTHEGIAETEEYMYTDVDGDIEYTVNLETPIVYEGKSLLVTWMTSGQISDLYEGFLTSQVFTAPDGQIHSGIKSSDSSLGMQTGALTNSSKDMPVLKIGYTPLIEQGGAKPVSIDNVELKLEGVDLAAGISSTYSKANMVAITFDVVDPSNVGTYEVFAGTQSIGTFTGTSGTVRFVPVSKNDLVLKIEAEGAIGTNYTIAADEIQALFPTPDARYTGNYALYTEFNIFNSGEGSISGAAQFQMTTTAPVARMRATSSGNAQTMHPGGGYSENIEALMPAGLTSSNYYDYEAAGGIIAVYNPSLGSCKLVGDELIYPTSFSISGQFACVYPVVTQAVPTVVAGTEAVAGTVSGTISEVTKDYNSGSSWSSSSITATMAVDDAHFVKDIIYPDKLRVREDKLNKTLQFFAPANTGIQYMFETAVSRAEGDWEDATTNPWTFNAKDSGAGILKVRTVDSETNEQKESMLYTVESDGTTVSIKSVVAPEAGKVEIYNLQGRRLAAPAKGINIINGKKIIF